MSDKDRIAELEKIEQAYNVACFDIFHSVAPGCIGALPESVRGMWGKGCDQWFDDRVALKRAGK